MEARTHSPTLKESTIVERVARIVSSVRGTKPDYTRLAAELEPAIPFDVFGVVLLRHDRQAVRVTVCQKDGSSWIAYCHQHPLEESMAERVLHSPFTRMESYPTGLDGPPFKCGDALCGFHQLRSAFIAPLIVGDRILGTLELGSTVLDTYADETLQRLIEAVVRVLAAAIESAQVGGSAEIQDRQRQALKDVSSALTSKMDLSTILNQIVDGIAKALNVASAIVTFDQRENKLRLEAQSGLEPEKLGRIVSRKDAANEKTIIGYTLRRYQPCVSHDISIDERFPGSLSFTTELGIRSFFSYPLVTDSTVYGALLLCSPEPGGFTPLKADILSLFASQATIAIHNGLLIESAHQRSRFQHVIEQLERAREQDLDEQALLSRVRQEAERTFGVSFSSLLHFISDNLLTRNERDLHAILHAEQQEESVTLLTRTAETALERAEVLSELGRLLDQLKQSADHIKDAWFVVDLHGLCIYMNPAAEVLCGLHMSTITESTLEDIFTELLPRIRNREEICEYLRNFNQGNVYRKDLRCVLAMERVHRNDGQGEAGRLAMHEGSSSSLQLESISSDQHYQLTRYPLLNQQGTLIANVLQAHDFTAQVRDEKNKTALLSSVSHELRTPLTTIKAGVTGLLQIDVEWDEPTRREILAEIDAEADHLGVLVNALIEMSRIEMGALVLDKEWCDIVEVIDGALFRLERILVGRSVHTEFQPDLPLVYADHVQLGRVFYNLVEHMVRQNPDQAEILVSVDTFSDGTTDAPLQYLRAKVINHYCKVAVDENERIFQTFYGLNSRGSGLGLAISRGIVEAHQGQIAVEVAPGGESLSFVFTLPVAVDSRSLSLSSVRSNDVSSPWEAGIEA